MRDPIIHPATFRLLRFQMAGKLHRLVESVRTTRRRTVVLLGVLLGIVWLGQAIAGVLLRPAADPDSLRLWIPSAMLAYCLWHLVKTLTREPESPFEWSAAEEEWLHGGPVTRPQLIAYRLSSIGLAALVKSIGFAVVMLPDVHNLLSALIGMLLALLLIDCIRLTIEVAVNALSAFERWLLRAVVLLPLACLGLMAVVAVVGTIRAHAITDHIGVLIVRRASHLLMAVLQEQPGSWLLTPFQFYSNIILAPLLSLSLVTNLLIGICLVTASIAGLINLDLLCRHRLAKRERLTLELLRNCKEFAIDTTPASTRKSTGQVPSRLRGAGPVAWRQLQSAWNYRGTLAISLGLPILLCCVPLFAPADRLFMLMNVLGGVMFYTFLLLPSALILDFRRDIDRLSVLKSLPISPLALSLGQLAAPVVLAEAFQATVLSIAVVTQSISLTDMFGCLFLLIPFNVLIFATENWLFLLSPYRRNEAGMMVFIRTILAFTAKGILFGVAAGIAIAWALISVKVAVTFNWPAGSGQLVAVTGIWFLVATGAFLMTRSLARQFACFDVSVDSPAVS